MNITKVLESGDVERFHQCVGMTNQRNSEHQWGVSLLLQHFFPDCRKEVLLAAMTHDSTELVWGDIPATTKWSAPEIKIILDELEAVTETEWGIDFDITTEEKQMVKSCDMLEGMQYCLKRVEMGERKASVPFYAWYNHIEKNNLIRNRFQLYMIGEMYTDMGVLMVVTHGS
tara:strand:+ start:7662 stop:8177 length:516 start_codon:yes stop_codon:yes gene_type:complete